MLSKSATKKEEKISFKDLISLGREGYHFFHSVLNKGIKMPNPLMFTGRFPETRLRRNRQSSWSRDLMAENRVTVEDLIWPVFVREESVSPEIRTLPDIVRYSIPELLKEVGKNLDLGIQSVMLFPVIEAAKRDEQASEAFNEVGVLANAVRALKKAFPQVGVITDAALDSYTSHGQDGLIINGRIDNDESLKAVERHALVQAGAGADVIAPSEMMDGRIGIIRKALDRESFQEISIISYAAKYASCFYGPFRDALGSKSCLGKADKKTYQMDPANLQEALREVALDIQEGTDMVIIKPGVPYLDVVRRVKDSFAIPCLSFHVSGEYAMLKFAAQQGCLDYEQALLETMICFKRAGADGIITYAAPEVAQILKGRKVAKSA